MPGRKPGQACGYPAQEAIPGESYLYDRIKVSVRFLKLRSNSRFGTDDDRTYVEGQRLAVIETSVWHSLLQGGAIRHLWRRTQGQKSTSLGLGQLSKETINKTQVLTLRVTVTLPYALRKT